MPSGVLINYYGEEPFTPPGNNPYDPAYPTIPKTESRGTILLWQKYKNLIPTIVLKK